MGKLCQKPSEASPYIEAANSRKHILRNWYGAVEVSILIEQDSPFLFQISLFGQIDRFQAKFYFIFEKIDIRDNRS